MALAVPLSALAQNAAANETAPAAEARPALQRRFETADQAFAFTFDASAAPDLAAWMEKDLRPEVLYWYPKLARLLASDGFTPPQTVAVVFKNDMGGTPAYAAGGKLSLNAAWFRRELKREAIGCVIHELVHVVQSYGRAKQAGDRPAPTPGWLVEGIADYLRWYLYEPQSRGCEITRHNFANARHDGGYRVTANFLDWVSATCDRDLVPKLNAAAREGRYDEALWKKWTGKSVQELGDAWKRAHAQRLGLPLPSVTTAEPSSKSP
jgi:hypothetical protein